MTSTIAKVAGKMYLCTKIDVLSAQRRVHSGTDPIVHFCTTQHVLSRITGKELAELVNDLLPKALNILDFDNETEQRVSDDKVRQYLSELIGGASASSLQHYEKEERNRIIKQLKDFGASIRQISRLTGVSFGIIRKIQQSAQ